MVQRAAWDTLKFLGFQAERVRGYAPPSLDDFTNTVRLSWDGWVDQQRIGGFMTFIADLPVDQFDLRQGVAFAVLVQHHQAQPWLDWTLRAYRDYGVPPMWDGGDLPEPTLSFPQAIVSQTLDNLLADVNDTTQLPNSAELWASYLHIIKLEQLLSDAIERRRAQIIGEQMGD